MKKQIIVAATTNIGKIKEIQALLSIQPIDVMILSDFGPVPTPAEDADNFEDNAYKKASFYSKILGFPALADDSGLEIKSLDGAPGIHSARWAGEGTSDEEKNRMVLEKLDGVKNRRAAFTCALVLGTPGGDGLTWIGKCEGAISERPIGTNGFGYDPIFFADTADKTFGQMDVEEKSRFSHRGKALKEFISEIDKVLVWLRQRGIESRSHHHQ